MKTLDLIDSFSEFKEFKNIDRETLMHILEEIFRSALAKRYGTEDNFDIIANMSTAAENFRNPGYVDYSSRAQAYLVCLRRQLVHKYTDFYTFNKP